MLLGAMLAMVLLLAAPAFAQTATQTQLIFANKSIVQACNQLLQQNNPQTIDQDATQVNVIAGVSQSGTANVVSASNVQNAEQTGATQIGLQACNQWVFR
jgi:hypothetical protein